MTSRREPSEQELPVSRRTVLRGTVGAVAFGVLGTAATGSAAAMNKAELIEAMASEAGLSKADAKRALEGFINATTKALKKGDRIGLAEFGSFDPPQAARGANGPRDVEFTATHELAAALDLVPGAGDEKRAEARDWPLRKKPGRTRSASWGGPAPTVVVDADLLLKELGGDGRDSGLSKADAKRALDAFINATTTALKKGDEVSLVGFGSFSISKRSARTGRNPQTGKEIQIAAKNVVRFKAGAELSK